MFFDEIPLSRYFIKLFVPSIEKIFGHCGMMEEINKCNEFLFCLSPIEFLAFK
jgi:hypothetical protein